MPDTTTQMLAIGEEISLETNGGKVNVPIRGWREGSYVLVESPEQSWIPKTGEPIIGRYLLRGTYFGFETAVIGQSPEVKLLILSYPSNTVETSYRKEERFYTTIPIVAHKENNKVATEFQGMIINISKSGCRFLCSKRFKVDETLVITGKLPNGGELKDLNFLVAHVIEQNGKFQYGGSFSTMREAHKSALNDFFETNSFYTEAERVDDCGQKDKINIPIGGICTIQAGKARYRSIFRGFNYPKFALVDMPIIKGIPVTLQRHEPCIIRFQNSGTVFGFETQVIKQYTKPIPIWVLSYPGDMEQVNLRKSQRVQTFLPATMVLEGSEQKGAMVDLSMGGSQFVLGGNSVETGSKCFLRMGLPDGTKIDKLSCEIKNINECNGMKFAGLVFSNIGEADVTKINVFYSLCQQWFK